MLLQLNICNFALIEKLTVSFENGFNVLTGETGAGKSIIIDAINYVLGSKFNKDFIRTGESKTFVEAVFTLENNKTIELLKQFDIEFEELIIISRETFHTGKSIAKVNGKSVLVSNLKLISETLLDIHGQHENQALLSSTNHIYYLDSYAESELKDTLDEYKINYCKLNDINNKINEINSKVGNREKLLDFLQYQIKELEGASLKAGEDEELESRFNFLSNSEKINKVLLSAYERLNNGNDNSASLYDELGFIIKDLKSIEKHTEKIKNVVESLENAFYMVEEGIENIRNLKDSIVYDEGELEYINNRMYQINILKKKYGKTIEEIMTYKKNIEIEYEETINSSSILEKIETERKALIEKLSSQVKSLHKIRQEASKELEEKVKNELSYIGLDKSIFSIEIEITDTFYENGADKVQFFISTNPGEPLKPLDRIVSGGELSRIMLALKTVFVNQDNIPSVIFDEIDVGISGRIAQSVAEKMYSISRNHQVFCVTHLPQIACMSDYHYMVTKEVYEGKTYTTINEMSKEQKEYEIARMISTSEVTQLTLEHSRELIMMAELKKIN